MRSRGSTGTGQVQIRIENAEVVVVAKSQIEGEFFAYFPVVLRPEAEAVGGNRVDVTAESLYEGGDIRIQKSDIPTFYAPLCSYDAMKSITSFTSKICKADRSKIERAITLVEQHVDLEQMLAVV